MPRIDPLPVIAAVGRRAKAAEDRVAELEQERQAVLDYINIYGDTVLHAALDSAGLFPRAPKGKENA